MFGFLDPVGRAGRQLAGMLDNSRAKFKGDLPASLGSAVERIDPPLRAFQVYCMTATAGRRGYRPRQIAIIAAAVEAMSKHGRHDEVDAAVEAASIAFGTDEAQCRETMVMHLFTNFASLPPQAQDSLRIRFNAFHQATRISLATVMEDPGLLQQGIAEAPHIQLSPAEIRQIERRC